MFAPVLFLIIDWTLHVVPVCDFLAGVICSVEMTHGGRGFRRKKNDAYF